MLSRLPLAVMFGPRLSATARRRARGPAPDRVRIVVDVENPPASASLSRTLEVRAFERLPARVAGGVSGKLRLEPTRVAFHAGEDILPARAGGMAGAVDPSQAEAASFAEDRSSTRKIIGDVPVEIDAPACETVVTHVEAPGRERWMRLRIRLFAVSHPDPSRGPVGTRGLPLRRGNVGDSAQIITSCSEFPLEEIVWMVLKGGRWIDRKSSRSSRRTQLRAWWSDWRSHGRMAWWAAKDRSWGVGEVLRPHINRVEGM